MVKLKVQDMIESQNGDRSTVSIVNSQFAVDIKRVLVGHDKDTNALLLYKENKNQKGELVQYPQGLVNNVNLDDDVSYSFKEKCFYLEGDGTTTVKISVK